MTTITNSPVIGVTTATKYVESVSTHSFIVDVRHLKEALAVAESLEFVDSDKHIKILSTKNPADGLLIQSLQYPKGSVRCACIDVVSGEKCGEVQLCDDLSGLTNAEDARKAKDALKQLNGEHDYVEEVKGIIDKVNRLPSYTPIESHTVHLKVCGVDGGKCNFEYRRYPS